MKETLVHIAINEYILKVLTLSAENAHLKKVEPIMKRIGVVRISEMSAIYGIIDARKKLLGKSF